MSAFYIVIGILLLLAALFLIVAVLLQNGKSKGVSGTITGGAETFFGKTKAKSMDKKLAVMTTVVAVVFVLLVIIAYIFQAPSDLNQEFQDWLSRLMESIGTNDTASALVSDSTVSSTLGSDTASTLTSVTH